MQLGNGSAEARVETMLSILENYSLQHPQAEIMYRSTDRTYLADRAEYISTALVAWHLPTRFQTLEKGELKCISKKM